jgi:hypothetical protein
VTSGREELAGGCERFDCKGRESYIFRRFRDGSVEPYSPLLRNRGYSLSIRERASNAMLDQPEKTARLLSTLKAAVPFEVELTRPVAEELQSENVAAAKRARHVVTDVSYAGDIGGIMCHIVPPDRREAIVVSLTYVRVPHSMSRAAVIASYQKHRLKKLRKQNYE